MQLTANYSCGMLQHPNKKVYHDPYFSNYINFFSLTSIIIKVATNKNKVGPKYSDIWEYFTHGDHHGNGHYQAMCKLCLSFFKDDRPYLIFYVQKRLKPSKMKQMN